MGWRRGRERPRRGHEQRGHPLGGAADVLVLTAPGTTQDALTAPWLTELAEVHSVTDAGIPVRERDAVVLVASDLVALRRAITGVPPVGRAGRIAVVFERPVVRLPVPAQHPGWPAVEEVVARLTPDPLVVVRFATPVPARSVLNQIARAAAPGGELAVGWPAVGVRRQLPSEWPPADPGATVAALPRLLDQSTDFPADVALAGSRAGREDRPLDDHRVLGRPTRIATTEPDLTWEHWHGLPGPEQAAAVAARGPGSLGAVDELLVNPIGFERDPDGPVATLSGEGDRLLVRASGSADVCIDPDRGLSDVDLPQLRRLAGVRLGWSGGRGPQPYCRAVAGLAAAGVPLVTDGVPGWAGQLLAPDLLAALGRGVDLDDRLRREEHSVVLRRAALRGHASGPWRRGLAERHALQQQPAPRVTVLLATRRPGLLGFALRQVARQRGVDLELVLAAHGFEPDAGTLDRFAATSGVPVTPLRVDASVSLGEVLNRAAARAGGDVLLKMDDDDWYGPDFAADLVLARHYSGAELVGCPPEFTYLAALDLTTRGRQPTEAYRNVVAGGTILVDRGLFRQLGGFRHTVRYVDATLQRAARNAGAATYRSHGLGYVLRRAPGGHTWDPGLTYFLKAERAVDQWRGFRPSVLLEPGSEDRPEE